jgi:hypothetical protein
MFSLSAFWALFTRSGVRGYPILAYSRVKTPYQQRFNQTPKVIVTVSNGTGCQLITYSQAEFAACYVK